MFARLMGLETVSPRRLHQLMQDEPVRMAPRTCAAIQLGIVFTKMTVHKAP